MSMILFATTTAACLIVGIVSNLGKTMIHVIILPAKSRSDVIFCLQSYGTYLSCIIIVRTGIQ